MSDPSNSTSALTVLRDLLACEVGEMQIRLDGVRPGWKPLSRDWRIATEHERRAFGEALRFVLELLNAERPGAGAHSACSRNFYHHGKPLPRALVVHGFLSYGFEPPADYVAGLNILGGVVEIDPAIIATVDLHDETAATPVDLDDFPAHRLSEVKS